MEQWLNCLALWQQVALSLVLTGMAIIVIWALVTLIMLPGLAIIQQLLNPVENSTAMSSSEYLLGILTLDVAPGHTGEVMVSGGGRARQTYPAKLNDEAGLALEQGTKVVIVEKRRGVAYVMALNVNQ